MKDDRQGSIGLIAEEDVTEAWGTEGAVPWSEWIWLESTRGRVGVSAGLTDEALSVGVGSAVGEELESAEERSVPAVGRTSWVDTEAVPVWTLDSALRGGEVFGEIRLSCLVCPPL